MIPHTLVELVDDYVAVRRFCLDLWGLMRRLRSSKLSTLRLRRRKPVARRLRLTDVEADALRHSGLLARPDGTVDAVVLFPDGDYAVMLNRRFGRRLLRELEAAMDAIEPLIREDIN